MDKKFAPVDKIKKAVVDAAITPFLKGESFPGLDGWGDVGYRIIGQGRLWLTLSIDTEQGPRYFTVKVTENI